METHRPLQDMSVMDNTPFRLDTLPKFNSFLKGDITFPLIMASFVIQKTSHASDGSLGYGEPLWKNPWAPDGNITTVFWNPNPNCIPTNASTLCAYNEAHVPTG